MTTTKIPRHSVGIPAVFWQKKSIKKLVFLEENNRNHALSSSHVGIINAVEKESLLKGSYNRIFGLFTVITQL